MDKSEWLPQAVTTFLDAMAEKAEVRCRGPWPLDPANYRPGAEAGQWPLVAKGVAQVRQAPKADRAQVREAIVFSADFLRDEGEAELATLALQAAAAL